MGLVLAFIATPTLNTLRLTLQGGGFHEYGLFLICTRGDVVALRVRSYCTVQYFPWIFYF